MAMQLRTFLNELRARNVRKTLAIYISSALTTIGILKLFAEAYNLPQSIFPIVVTIFTCGLAGAVVFAWYHGKAGAQRVHKREALLYTLIASVALVVSLRFSGTTKAPLMPLDAKTIAVLPFENFSDKKEDEYFSDGIMEDILMQLSKIRDLRVISRTSMMTYKGTKKKINEIAAELGVGTILEGSIRRTGNRVRVVGQLIDAKTDKHIWADTYDREMQDIFAIQSDVAQRIAAELKATLSPEETQRIQKKPTHNLEAYAYYIRGRDYFDRHNNQDNERSIELLLKAVHLDPGYALAYAELARAYVARYYPYGQAKAWADSGIATGVHAVDLMPIQPRRNMPLEEAMR